MKIVTKESKQAPHGRNWMVAYTRSRWEKKSDKLLSEQGITSYCPVIKTKKQWADRVKSVDVPLFSSYIFVYTNVYEQQLVQLTPGIVNFVHHCNKPVVINDAEISRIHSLVDNYSNIEAVNLNTIRIGDKLKINDGPLMNRYGEVIKVEGKSVLMVMEQLGCALIVKVDQGQILESAACV
jgi:transcription antitermination factor NusG